MPQPIMPATPGPLSVVLLRSSERMLDASNERPSMRPDVFVRRRGRGAASTCFDTGAADGAAAIGAACAVVTDDGVAGAGTGVGAGFGGSDLAMAFSPVLRGAPFTGVAGFGGVVDFDGVVVTVSA